MGPPRLAFRHDGVARFRRFLSTVAVVKLNQCYTRIVFIIFCLILLGSQLPTKTKHHFQIPYIINKILPIWRTSEHLPSHSQEIPYNNTYNNELWIISFALYGLPAHVLLPESLYKPKKRSNECATAQNKINNRFIILTTVNLTIVRQASESIRKSLLIRNCISKELQ